MADEFLETAFDDRNASRVEKIDLRRVDVRACDAVTQRSQTSPRGQADVPGADHGDFCVHGFRLASRLEMHSRARHRPLDDATPQLPELNSTAVANEVREAETYQHEFETTC